MISAHIEMDLDQHISVVSAKIIELMQEKEDLILESLMRRFLKLYENYTPEQFIDGLTFLFSIDVLSLKEYRVGLKNV